VDQRAVSVSAAKNVLELCSADTDLRRISSTEYAGPCPKCGGTDRFHVTSEWWMCRQCHYPRGDAIEYLRWLHGLSFGEACHRLGMRPDDILQRSAKPTVRPDAILSEPPPAKWQTRAREFVSYSQDQLAASGKAMGYLVGRGLSSETIACSGLGYNPRDLRDDGAAWGLSGKVWLPQGLVIPCEMGDSLWFVKVRREQSEPKYVAVKGSHKRGVVYGLGAKSSAGDLILCEGELNALILRQCLAPVAQVVSVGDAGNRPGHQALTLMLRYARWWSLFDPDSAGQKGARSLRARYPRFRTLGWFYENDANDAFLAGHSLAMRLLPQIGPQVGLDGGIARSAWLEHWLRALDPLVSGSGIDRLAPKMQLWYALYGEYGKLGFGSSSGSVSSQTQSGATDTAEYASGVPKALSLAKL